MNWKVGDWVIYDLRIGQIKRVDNEGFGEFSDGVIASAGKIVAGFRELTLRNKNIAETFDFYYEALRKIDGEAGFNYPDISQYFNQLALNAIDGIDGKEKVWFDFARDFVASARNHEPLIQRVRLFSRAL